jgi:eukaryotic-like serine/threonine-protein kinase
MKDPSIGWRLRIFHGVCVGLHQLHSLNIIHQDLKPSNILVFEKTKSKIADLGRATVSGIGAKFSEANHWGDPGYTPIEFHYNHFETDPITRQKAADFYMLGGILAFLVANINIFSLVLTKLPSAYHPMNWSGDYAAALPALHSATNEAIRDIEQTVPDILKVEIREMLQFLCNPEPTKRGHIKNVIQAFGNKYSLERLISVADRIANKARLTS